MGVGKRGKRDFHILSRTKKIMSCTSIIALEKKRILEKVRTIAGGCPLQAKKKAWAHQLVRRK